MPLDGLLAPRHPLAHAALSPHLKESQNYAVDNYFEADWDEFFDSWSPVAVLICTRKRDGAAAEVCRWDGLLAEDGVNSMVGREDPYGSLSFNYESLNLPRELEGLCGLGWKVIEYYEQIQSSATLFFDKSTGRLRYIYTGFMDEHTNYMPPEILRMHLHALCDEAVRG